MVAVLSVSQWLLVETSVMESFTLSQVWSLILTSLHKLLNTRLLENVIFLCCRPPVSRQLEVIKLAVDSTSEQKAAPRTPTSDSPLDTLYIGGRIHHSVFNPCNKTCWRKILLLVYLWVCTWRCLSFFFHSGTTKTNRLSVSSPFVGCLRNVKLNGKPVSLEKGSRRGGPVSVHTCPAYWGHVINGRHKHQCKF